MELWGVAVHLILAELLHHLQGRQIYMLQAPARRYPLTQGGCCSCLTPTCHEALVGQILTAFKMERQITLLLVSPNNFDMPVVQFYICNMSKHARDMLPGREGRVCRGLSRGSLPVRNTGEMGAGAGSCA